MDDVADDGAFGGGEAEGKVDGVKGDVVGPLRGCGGQVFVRRVRKRNLRK